MSWCNLHSLATPFFIFTPHFICYVALNSCSFDSFRRPISPLSFSTVHVGYPRVSWRNICYERSKRLCELDNTGQILINGISFLSNLQFVPLDCSNVFSAISHLARESIIANLISNSVLDTTTTGLAAIQTITAREWTSICGCVILMMSNYSSVGFTFLRYAHHVIIFFSI